MKTLKAGEVVKHGNIEVGLREIGPQQAAEVLEMNYQRQRKLDERHVAFLANEMEQGRFMQGTKVHACTLPNRQQCLINGQHTVSAILKSGIPQLLTVQITRCKDEEEVAVCYAREDVNKRRTPSDLYSALGADQRLGVSRTVATRLCQAVGFLYGTMFDGPKKMSAETVVEIAEAMKEAIQEYVEWFGGMPPQAAPLNALGLITSANAKAPEFWKKYQSNDGLKKDDPARALHELQRNLQDRVKLKEMMLDVGIATNGARSLSRAELLFFGAAVCFNAYSSGKRLPAVTVKQIVACNRVHGTRLDNKEVFDGSYFSHSKAMGIPA